MRFRQAERERERELTTCLNQNTTRLPKFFLLLSPHLLKKHILGKFLLGLPPTTAATSIFCS